MGCSNQQNVKSNSAAPRVPVLSNNEITVCGGDGAFFFFFKNPDKGARIWVVVYFERSPGVTRLVLTGDQKSVQSGRCESEWSSEYISWAVWREKEQIFFCGFFFFQQHDR